MDKVYERATEVVAEVLGIHGLSEPNIAAQDVVDSLVKAGLTITDPSTIDD